MSVRRPLAACACVLTILNGLTVPAIFARGVRSNVTEQASAATDRTNGADQGGGTPEEFKNLKYRSIGPPAGGRVSRVAGIPGDPTTYYAATASGGVWKSTDGGHVWKPIFDDQPASSIGSIAVSSANPNVVYVGAGEANIRGNVAAGNGIYKSTDAGKTWTHVWKQESQIGSIVVHPTNPDIAFAAVLGHAFGPNVDRGIYRTRNGGNTWQQVLRKDADTGASDVAVDPSNPNTVFAGFWQARRQPWELISGGPGSGLYMSKDGGDTWRQLTGAGLPAGVWGKVGVAVAPSDGRVVYALIEAEQGGLFRSDDGGGTWSRTTADRSIRQRAWYYTTQTINPQNSNDVWFHNVTMMRTIDGGKTLRPVRGFHHGDHHDLWIDPLNPRRMIGANDGGVDISLDGGETWTAPRLPISQFYHVSVDNRVPYHVAGAMQDIGTAQGPSNSLDTVRIVLTDWYDVGGGEAGHVVSKTDDPNIVYAGQYLGYISRYDHRTRQARNVGAWPENPSGQAGEQMRYRFQWTAPIASSPHDPDVVYHAAQVLFRSGDAGQTWTAISPDLTTNDRSKQHWSGGPITGDNTGVETYCTIFSVAESPKQKNLIWAGTDDGLVHVTKDGGKNWTNVTAKMQGLPKWGTVSIIEPSPHDAATAYVVVDAHRIDDVRPYLFKTTDFGASWRRLDAGLPEDIYLHVVREDPTVRGLLYLGTERGVMFSTDDGAAWRSLRLNLPTVAVHDLVVKDDDLVVGTHGRSIWIFDDLQPLREMARNEDLKKQTAHLFGPANAIAWRYRRGNRDRTAGENRPRGAAMYYFLRSKPAGELKMEILDSSGRLVRTLRSTVPPDPGIENFEPEEPPKPALGVEPGVQRAVWNLRHEGATLIKRAKIDWGDPNEGPIAVPGKYSVRLTGDGIDLSAPLVVQPDPRVAMSQADLETQLRTALAIRDDISRLTGIVNQLRLVRDQLKQRNEIIRTMPQAAELVKWSETLVTKLDNLEQRLHNPTAEVTYDILAMKGGTRLYSRLSPLMMFATDGDGMPTQGLREVYAEQRKELDRFEAELKELLSTELAVINREAGKLGLAFVVVPAQQ